MLTRLKVDGFKNLLDVDVYFGPFTCIAGPNGAGKSNLFDAVAFLSSLSDKFFVDAARTVRGGEDVRSLFSDPVNGVIEIRAEMLIPQIGEDDFGQKAEASASFVYYELRLALEEVGDAVGGAKIRLEHEELNYISKKEAPKHLLFPHSRKWFESVVKASPRRTTFIQTDEDERRGRIIRLQSDRMQGDEKNRRGGGGAAGFLATTLPRTVLSSAQNADETRTAVLVRQEMKSWRQLQLEPSSLRSVDDFESPTRIDASGKHIPAVLQRLAKNEQSESEIYTKLANSLVSLVEDVRSVRVDRDEVRRALRFMMKDRNGLELPASSLSDGTMRFVALSVIELDPTEGGVICLEEPENGIHPQRVNSMLDLLYRIAFDTDYAIGVDNPLRQVVISTHSPSVVKHLNADDVVFAVSRSVPFGGSKIRGVGFLGLSGSWRHRIRNSSIGDGQALAYLKGLPLNSSDIGTEQTVAAKYRAQLSFPLKSAE